MKFTSTRNKTLHTSFIDAICNCMPSDGGLYVPCDTEDLRRWISYIDENTSFTSIAGTLTSAFFHEELSPVICENIASRAFTFSPEIKQLDEKLFLLDLTKGPSGSQKDFGLSFLINTLETYFQWEGGTAVFCDVTTGHLGSLLANLLKEKRFLKSVLIYPKGTVCGLSEEDFVWNGGNIFPVEVDGTEQDCHEIVRKIFQDAEFVKRNKLTVANTANIGRLLPQAYFYPFAFSRIKNKVSSDIYYALDAGNYSNVVAGLYSWRFALPMNGFIVPSTNNLTCDAQGNPIFLDSVISIENRLPCDPAEPLNIERLEEIFNTNKALTKYFIFPQNVSDSQIKESAQELFMKYKILADKDTSRAYSAYKNFNSSAENQEYSTVLVSREHNCYSKEFIQHTTGEIVETPELIQKMQKKVELNRPFISTAEELKRIINNLYFQQSN